MLIRGRQRQESASAPDSSASKRWTGSWPAAGTSVAPDIRDCLSSSPPSLLPPVPAGDGFLPLGPGTGPPWPSPWHTALVLGSCHSLAAPCTHGGIIHRASGLCTLAPHPATRLMSRLTLLRRGGPLPHLDNPHTCPCIARFSLSCSMTHSELYARQSPYSEHTIPFRLSPPALISVGMGLKT